MSDYKMITRKYYDPDTKEIKQGLFVAEGEWANGNLAYTRYLDEEIPIEDDACMWVQKRVKKQLIMFHV